MTLPIFKERRLSSRRILTGLLPAPLVLRDEPEQKFNCKPVDISSEGLGVLADIVLPVGTELLLKLPEEDVLMKIYMEETRLQQKGAIPLRTDNSFCRARYRTDIRSKRMFK